MLTLAVVFLAAGIGLAHVTKNVWTFTAAPVATLRAPDIRTATIRLAPDHNDKCREFVLDNATGEIQKKASVNCANDKRNEAVRVEDFKQSFKRQ